MPLSFLSKSSAATIKNDNHFKVARDAILEKRGVCKIFVDIDAAALRGFCVDEPVRSHFVHRSRHFLKVVYRL